MIPFKALISNLSHGSGGSWATYSDDYESGSERENETREYRRFNSLDSSISRIDTARKLKQDVEITREVNEEVTFWSWSRITSNVRLKGGEGGGGLWQEFSGALGDAGTFLPAVLALALVNGLDLGTTLLFTGMFNLGTGLLFGIPMPVQPMSAIVLAALNPNSLTVPQIMAAGLITGLVLAILGITGFMKFLYRLIPIPVVRGVMLCEGLITGFKGVKYILEKQDSMTMQSVGTRSWLGFSGLVLPISILLFLVVVSGVGKSSKEEDEAVRSQECMGRNGEDSLLGRGSTSLHYRYIEYETGEGNWRRTVLRLPTALIILLVALSLAIAINPSTLRNLELGPSALKLVKISSQDWEVGFLQAAVYQIPVTILSSVISISKLSGDYFPGGEVSPNAVCVSVGLMNLVGCWFGAVPVCHGAVGLAAQYRFGARSGLSMVMLGTLKLLLGLLLGSSLLSVLSQFPVSLLGILLLSSGLELALICGQQNSRSDAALMLAVVVVSIGASTAYNSSLGFLCGVLLHFLLKLHEWIED